MTRSARAVCILLSFLAHPVQAAGGRDGRATAALDGVYQLVSSRGKGFELKTPHWEGKMLIKSGHFSRIYSRKLAPVNAKLPQKDLFHANGGSIKVQGRKILMKIEMASYRPLEGQSFGDAFSWAKDGRTLTLSDSKGGKEFQEVWKKLRASTR